MPVSFLAFYVLVNANVQRKNRIISGEGTHPLKQFQLPQNFYRCLLTNLTANKIFRVCTPAAPIASLEWCFAVAQRGRGWKGWTTADGISVATGGRGGSCPQPALDSILRFAQIRREV